MRKYIITMLFFLISNLAYSESLSTAVAVDGKNRTVISTNTAQEWADGQLNSTLANSFNILQPYTSGAIDIYVSSNAGFNQVTGKVAVCVSSISLRMGNAISAGATTSWYDLRLSTSDSVQDVVDKINLTPNWTASLVQGCYELALCTGTRGASFVRNLGEGYDDGLQYTAGTEKTVSISTGIANKMTLYFNAITKLSYRKDATIGKSYVYGTIDGNIAFPTGLPTMTIYEGVYSTNCVTQKTSPYSIATTNVYFKNTWDVDFPIVTTSGYANKYEISNSSWITSGYFGVTGQSLSR